MFVVNTNNFTQKNLTATVPKRLTRHTADVDAQQAETEDEGRGEGRLHMAFPLLKLRRGILTLKSLAVVPLLRKREQRPNFTLYWPSLSPTKRWLDAT